MNVSSPDPKPGLALISRNPTLKIPSAPDTEAKNYVLMEAKTGTFLAKKEMDEQVPPASLTKLMTLYLIAQSLESHAIKLDTKVPISKKAWKTGGSKMFVRVGRNVAVSDLLQGIIVASGNDACVAMAEFLGGSESSFAKMMNEQAERLGMTHTHYIDSTGLTNSPSHYTTAYDLALLTRALILDFPQYYPWYQQKWFTYNGIKQPNRNRLLWRYSYADGVKTGHTNAAGYCLVSSAIKNNTRLISVVLGTSSDEKRASSSMALLNYGFRFYKSALLYPERKAILEPRVWFGKYRTIPIGVESDLYITTAINEKKSITTQVNINALPIKAPIKKGQKLGTLTALLDGQPISSQTLVALKDDPRGGFFRCLVDRVTYLFSRWMSPYDFSIKT
jgi:D-alanyl-D-alanine carboxypeptidase (penicillin-binding protein 5/6)